PIEGVEFSGTVVVIGYAGEGGDPIVAATVAWGDGGSDTYSVNSGLLQGEHTYAETGDYLLTVTVSDPDGHWSTHTAIAHVGEPPIVLADVNLVEGQTFSGILASWAEQDLATGG